MTKYRITSTSMEENKMSIAEWLQFAGVIALGFMIFLAVCGLALAFFVVRYVVKKIKEEERE